jgi:hypothetical protein
MARDSVPTLYGNPNPPRQRERANLVALSSEDESNRIEPSDLLEPLREQEIEINLLAKNPITDEVWAIIVDLAKNHGQGAVISTTILTLIGLWLKERLGRRIELERGDFKITAPTTKELKKALLTLNEYDKLNLTINNSTSNKRQLRKPTQKQLKPARKRSKKQ